jgi:hypothetical protein
MKYLNYILFTALLLASACTNDLELRKATLSDYDDFDTIEVAKDHNIYILYGLKRLDIDLEKETQSSITALFVKYDANNGMVVYKIYKDQGIEVSKDYVAFSNGSSGWSYIKDETIIDVIPNTQTPGSSQSHVGNDNDVIIKDTNGYILINGKQVKTLHNGIFAPLKDKEFDSLDYKLYRLKDDSLIVASNNVNDLKKQKHGVYFVPPPGYGVVKMYSKKQIFNAIDSVSKLTEKPSKIFIKSIL